MHAVMMQSAAAGHAVAAAHRMHAWTVSGVPPRRLDIMLKDLVAASTRAGSACTSPGGYSPARSRSPSTYSEPPMPPAGRCKTSEAREDKP